MEERGLNFLRPLVESRKCRVVIVVVVVEVGADKRFFILNDKVGESFNKLVPSPLVQDMWRLWTPDRPQLPLW